MNKKFHDQLVEEILRARERIYHVNKPTPLEEVCLRDIDAQVYFKREDLSTIKAYKWRGAYNCISMLSPEQRKKPIIAASAGNHAQGVALACRKLGLKAKIYMPLSTPQMKQNSVLKHGGENVEIVLVGDSYSDTAAAAMKEVDKKGAAFIHPFDNLYTIAGQATIADELVLSGQGPFDYCFIAIGGGGMAAGMSKWLRIHYPNIKIFGVEGVDQASMKASIEAGKPVTLEEVDTFCDGTAVKTPGNLTFEICRETLDGILTVTNEEVCAAIETTWETGRFIPEPSGAMGLAGLMKYAQENPKEIKGKKLVTPICGANMDFSRLRQISANSAVGAHRLRFLRFTLQEKSGSLLDILNKCFQDVSISAFQYGKISEDMAFPVIGLQAAADRWDSILQDLKKNNVHFEDVTGAPDITYRIINYNPQLFKNPVFLNVNFPERKGALRELLKLTSKVSNVCYFNYFYTGELFGRALMGFEFESPSNEEKFFAAIEQLGIEHSRIEGEALKRITL
ncbi:MAG: pyridoxal-phosphate dependent enzyme [Rhodospirillales bacterium]|nr:pyridoxal-phosphate dependent enzyme [Rhodospirillales bacterium]MCB9979603.1 pyridoxal-phosphate dependent enzyme [Rhodospirillales bacterium]